MSKPKLVVSKPKFYDQKYFAYQQKIGEFGGKANLYKFKPYIKASDKVIDFGCGGGYLLKEINCREKMGVEISSVARKAAQAQGIQAYAEVQKIPNNWADVIISNHALEHTFFPLGELQSLLPKLKKKGRIIFVVPQEIRMPWEANNVNHHLYTWSPLSLGNLFTLAGFQVEKVETIHSLWPPFYLQIWQIGGERLFRLACQIYGHLDGHLAQVRIIAHKA